MAINRHETFVLFNTGLFDLGLAHTDTYVKCAQSGWHLYLISKDEKSIIIIQDGVLTENDLIKLGCTEFMPYKWLLYDGED